MRLVLRVGMRSIIATLAVVIVFSLEWQARLAGSGDPRLLLNRFWNSVFGASHSGTLESPSSGGSEILAEGSSAGEGPQSVAPNSALRHRKLVLPPQRPSDKATSVGKPTREAARAAPPAPLAASEESAHIADARNDSVSMPNGRTAIYDIAAHAVYLPNGDRLEARSGLGSNLDDPRSVSVKNGGPTPPNVCMSWCCGSSFSTEFAPSGSFLSTKARCLAGMACLRILTCMALTVSRRAVCPSATILPF